MSSNQSGVQPSEQNKAQRQAATEEVQKEAADTPAPASPDKFPELTKLQEDLKKERDALLNKSAGLRKERDALVKQIQPMETKLRDVNERIREIEQPRLSDIDVQLGRLSVAMGGRAINKPEG